MADQPTYTRVPNALLEAMPSMGDAEMRVVFAIARKTIGWQKECDVISITQLEALTGLRRPSVVAGLKAALEHKLIERTEASRNGYCYRLVNLLNQSTDLTSQVNELELVNLLNQSEPPLVKQVNTQKKDSKEKKEKSARARDPALDTLPIIAYRETFKCWPNSTQRKAINDQVQDLDRWQKVLDDWHLHGWRPTNVKDMLDRYSQNGYRNGSSKLLRQSPGRTSERKPQVEADLDKPF